MHGPLFTSVELVDGHDQSNKREPCSVHFCAPEGIRVIEFCKGLLYMKVALPCTSTYLGVFSTKTGAMLSYWCIPVFIGSFALNVLGSTSFPDLTAGLTDVCPFTNFCTKEGEFIPSGNESTPCCVSCLCTTNCHLHGNCCPDVQHEADDKLPKPVCYFPVFNADEKTQYNNKMKFFSGINSYNTFVTCPSTFTDAIVRDLCENSPKDLTSLTVVSDNLGIVYRNKHCAECHGKTSYIAWDLKITCPTTKTETNIQMGNSLEKFKPCMVWSLPPEPKVGSKSLCYKTIDTCNVTGEMKTYDASLNYKCESFTLYYLHTYWKVSQLFNNIYCYLCNTNTPVDLKICPSELQILRNDILVEFTGVLNKASFFTMTTPVQPKCRKRCAKWQIYDPLFNTCRKLTCQAGSRPFYGDCLNIYDNTVGYSLSMLLELRPILNHSRSHDTALAYFNYADNYNDMIRFIKTVARSTTQHRNKCTFCNGVLVDGGNATTKHLKALVTFHTNRMCDIYTLYESAYNYAAREDKITSFNTQQKKLWYNTLVNVNLTSDDIFNMLYENKASYFEKFIGEPEPFRGEIVCPKITLHESEYSTFLKQTTLTVPVKRNIRLEEIHRLQNSEKDVDGQEEVGGKENDISKNRYKVSFDFDICSHHYMSAVGGCNKFHSSVFTIYIVTLCSFLFSVEN